MVAREAIAGEPGGLGERIAEFTRFLIREDRSPATIRTYQWALKDFREFLVSRGVTAIHQLSRPLLEAWQDRLIAARMRPRSRSLATTAVRQFLKWAGDHEYCDARLANWLATVKVKPLQPKPLPPESLAKLRAYYSPKPTGLKMLRDRAMFFYFVTTGARVSEALQVTRSDFPRAIVRQKGGTDKLLVIPPAVELIVRDYLAARHDLALLVFVTHPGERPLQPGAVRDVWQQVAAKLGLPPFTTHQLRHTFATELLERGVDPVTVAELLGHHGMQTIRNYAKVGPESRARAMRAIEEVLEVAPVKETPPDPRAPDSPFLRKVKRRGRPRFRILD